MMLHIYGINDDTHDIILPEMHHYYHQQQQQSEMMCHQQEDLTTVWPQLHPMKPAACYTCLHSVQCIDHNNTVEIHNVI